MKEGMKEEIVCVQLNSFTDNPKDINVEDPYTFTNRLLVYKRNPQTGEIHCERVRVESLMAEKELIEKRNAELRGITFAKFLEKKYGRGKLYLLPFNGTIGFDSEYDRTKE